MSVDFDQPFVSGHGCRFIELPVGEAGQVEATLSMSRRKGRHSGKHVLPDDSSVFVFECVFSNPRSDHSLCTAEPIEFLPAEEQLSARFG